jgi:Fuc2NAc and GlcNAc transferase
MRLAIALALAGGAAWILTGVARSYALRREMIDLPNHRSSHAAPTPRGGGIAIAAVAVVAVGVVTSMGMLSGSEGAALLVGAVVVAGTGWLDDHRDVHVGWRALAQLAAALWVVSWIGVPEELRLGTWAIPWGAVGYPITVLGLIWLTNLFNFMDGTDGLAAAEAIVVGAVGGGMLIAGGAAGVGALALVIAAASAGFLVWNWPPARVFMGDVGSGLLGFLLGSIALAGSVEGAVPLVLWVLLLGVFFFDATVTLLRRVAAGEPFSEAHRRHAYQRAVQSGFSHTRVLVAVLILNMVLVGLALAALFAAPFTPVFLVAAGLLLTVAYLAVERRRPMWQEGSSQQRTPVGTNRHVR